MRTRYLEADEISSVASYLKGHSRTVWLLMNATGLRISDAIKIKHSDIDKNGVLYWKSAKTGKTASRILPGEILHLMKKDKVFNPDDYIFKSFVKPNTHIHRSTVYRDIKKACKLAHIDSFGVGTHSARKSFAVKDFRENGLGKTMHDLQHSNAGTTLVYALSDNPIPRIYKEIETIKAIIAKYNDKIKEIDKKFALVTDKLDLICNYLFPPDEPLKVKLKDEKKGY